MPNSLGIIQVPKGLSPATSHLGRMLGGKSVLEWVIRRVTDCQRLDAIVVVLEDQPDERRWSGLVPPDVPIHYSTRTDALGHCADMLESYPARAAAPIVAHNLFLDPVLIDRLASTADAHVGCDYIGYGLQDGQPAVTSTPGLFAEWCRADALLRADCEALIAADREQVTRYVYSRPEEFGVRLMPLPVELESADVRRQLDCSENWELAQAIYESLGADEWDWRRLAGFVTRHAPHRKLKPAFNLRQATV